MAITLYNPKYFKNMAGDRVENTADVKRFVWSHAYWNLKVGEIKKFPDEVGRNMIRLIEFLVEVTPKNIAQIKREKEAKVFKCDKCDFETDTRISLLGHSRKHTGEEEQSEELKDVEEATPQGNFKSVASRKKLTIEEEEGIPKGESTDNDGVPWYGAGTETDNEAGFVSRMGSK